MAASDAAAPPIRRAAAGPPPSPPRCGAEECLCRFGREFDGARARRTRGALRGGGDDAEDAWEDFRLVRCGSCAEAHCAHARCAGLGRAARAWTCELCTRAAVNATAAQRPPPIAERRVTRAADAGATATTSGAAADAGGAARPAEGARDAAADEPPATSDGEGESALPRHPPRECPLCYLGSGKPLKHRGRHLRAAPAAPAAPARAAAAPPNATNDATTRGETGPSPAAPAPARAAISPQCGERLSLIHI